jgi:hypothetical protein
MKTIVRIFLLSLWAALIGFWPAGADAQVGAIGRCGLGSPGGILGLGGAGARAAMIKRTIKCLQATGQAPATGSPGTGGRFVTFDPPGSTSTTPTGITPDGTIVGWYCDTAACALQGGFVGAHGFLRTPTGNFATFDPPGSKETTPTSISPSGEIVGAYCDTAACPRIHGFVRARDGTFTTFDSPGSSGGIFNSIYGFLGSPPPSINPAGAVAGTYFVSVPSYTERGFLRDKNGVIATINAPGSTGNTEVLAINPSGVMVGDLFCCTGFIRYPNGSFTTIESRTSVLAKRSSPEVSIRQASSRAGH